MLLASLSVRIRLIPIKLCQYSNKPLRKSDEDFYRQQNQQVPRQIPPELERLTSEMLQIRCKLLQKKNFTKNRTKSEIHSAVSILCSARIAVNYCEPASRLMMQFLNISGSTKSTSLGGLLHLTQAPPKRCTAQSAIISSFSEFETKSEPLAKISTGPRPSFAVAIRSVPEPVGMLPMVRPLHRRSTGDSLVDTTRT